MRRRTLCIWIVSLLIFAACIPVAGRADDLGSYVGTVQTEWLTDGRHMRLLAPFSYYDPKGLEWMAPAGSVVDGASIPQFAWSFIGGPFEGKYRNASVIHDVACDQKSRPWESVHETFYWAMLASEVERWRAKTMYAAVYHFGPRWPRVVTVPNLPRTQTPIALETARSQAAAGSQVSVRSINPRPRSFPDILAGRPESADFLIEVRPPALKLQESDFERLKSLIEVREPSAPGGMSLDEIRNFTAGQ